MTACNIKAAWARAGLSPLNPDRVLRTIPNPPSQNVDSEPVACFLSEDPPLRTPVTFDEVVSMRRYIEHTLQSVPPNALRYIQKLGNSAERVVTARDALFEENSELFRQNNANTTRTSQRSIMVGKAKVMSYEDIEEAIRKREEKEAGKGSGRGRKRKTSASTLRHVRIRAKKKAKRHIAN